VLDPRGMRIGPMALAATLLSCSRGEPPAPDASPSVAAPELPTPSTSSAAVTTGSTSAPAPSTSASSDASVDPATLPQTRDRPVASGPAFEARVAALWSAIVADDPQQAVPFFFPVGAYQQVKDIPDPASDWKHRLFAAYAHDIHALHRALGTDATRATFKGLEVPEARGRWVDPGEEYNKIGYYRVFGSRLRYELDGDAHAFDVKSLISWRGEWYVVHLSAIK
jgi:hypothetical protein